MTTTHDSVARTTRVPLTTWAIAFGLAGLAEVWNAAATVLDITVWVPRAFWLVAAAAWVALLTTHAWRGRRAGQTLADQLRHPAQGPLASLVPVTAMLLGAELATVDLAAGRVVVLVAIGVQTLYAGWLISRWLGGRFDVDALHGGYLLPTVAAGLVAADAAASVGERTLGWMCFGVGCLFAIIVTTALLIRFALRPPLPAPLMPSMSILMAPPAVAGLAWLTLTGGRAGPVAAALAGCTVLMVAVQLALLPRYVRLPVSIGFWSFTFPTAAVATFAVEWLEATGSAIADTAATLAVVLLTAFMAAVAVASLRALHRRPPMTAPTAPGTARPPRRPAAEAATRGVK